MPAGPPLPVKFWLERLVPLLVAVAILAALALAIGRFARLEEEVERKRQVEAIRNILDLRESALEHAIHSRIYYTRGIAGIVSYSPDITDDQFQRIVREYRREDPLVHSMSLAEDFVISSIYPPELADKVVGLDLMAHPQRRDIVRRTLESGKTFVAGPVTLVEGGEAFISYTPVFDLTSPGGPEVWGMSDIVIPKDPLLQEAGLVEEENGLHFALRGVDGTGIDGAVFWGNPAVFEGDHLTVSVPLPTGEWLLAAAPANGFAKVAGFRNRYLFLYLSAAAIALLAGLLARLHLRIKKRERELTALFRTIHSIVIEIDRDGVYRRVAPAGEELLVRPPEDLIGRNVREVLAPELAEAISAKVAEALGSDSLATLDYPLEVHGVVRRFHGRFFPVSSDSVVLVAHDMTARIEAEERLRESRRSLEESLRTRDKLFSVIAHDLRNPVGGFSELARYLVENFEDTDRNELREIIFSLHESSSAVFFMLENLLEWTGSQTGRISFRPELEAVAPIATEVLSVFTPLAQGKGVELANEIHPGLQAWCDRQLVFAILRNLVSNGVKFTSEGGRVSLRGRLEPEAGVVVLEVADTGAGMEAERVATLFDDEVRESTFGTGNEKGTGLGLGICREFVEISGGRIEVESELGKGTVIRFTLPAAPTSASAESK